MKREDSKSELYFEWWCQELKDSGYIREFADHEYIFRLTPQYQITTTKVLITQTKEVTRTLLQPGTYTPDFTIVWNRTAIGVLIQELFSIVLPMPHFPFQWYEGEMVSQIDVKPSFTKRTSDRTVFSWLQKLVYMEYGTFVQPIVVETLFKRTFTPKRYNFTDKSFEPRVNKKTGKVLKPLPPRQRKRKWVFRSLNQFMKEMGDE